MPGVSKLAKLAARGRHTANGADGTPFKALISFKRAEMAGGDWRGDVS
jgi:hypothetical protein